MKIKIYPKIALLRERPEMQYRRSVRILDELPAVKRRPARLSQAFKSPRGIPPSRVLQLPLKRPRRRPPRRRHFSRTSRRDSRLIARRRRNHKASASSSPLRAWLRAVHDRPPDLRPLPYVSSTSIRLSSRFLPNRSSRRATFAESRMTRNRRYSRARPYSKTFLVRTKDLDGVRLCSAQPRSRRSNPLGRLVRSRHSRLSSSASNHSAKSSKYSGRGVRTSLSRRKRIALRLGGQSASRFPETRPELTKQMGQDNATGRFRLEKFAYIRRPERGWPNPAKGPACPRFRPGFASWAGLPDRYRHAAGSPYIRPPPAGRPRPASYPRLRHRPALPFAGEARLPGACFRRSRARRPGRPREVRLCAGPAGGLRDRPGPCPIILCGPVWRLFAFSRFRPGPAYMYSSAGMPRKVEARPLRRAIRRAGHTCFHAPA